MKLKHSYILRLVLVFVRVLCSSDNELYLEWYWSFCVVCLPNWGNQFDWQFKTYGSQE